MNLKHFSIDIGDVIGSTEISHAKVNLSQIYEDIKSYFKIITVIFSFSLHGP